LIDYPGKLSSVIFVGGCNFRCPFCHNSELVLNPDKMPDISEDEVLGFLKSRKEWVEGVVITGGEPTMHRELPYFIEKIKGLGIPVKLDTNGTNNVMLRQLINSGLLDYIAMDIKAPLSKYEAAAGMSKAADAVGSHGGLIDIKESVKDIMSSNVKYEFRTTVVPRLHKEADIIEIGQWLKGADKFVIQQFRPMTPIDPDYRMEKAYPRNKLDDFAEKLRPFFKRVEVKW
jgi:pyruvate formate lyase activating enzyme